MVFIILLALIVTNVFVKYLPQGFCIWFKPVSKILYPPTYSCLTPELFTHLNESKTTAYEQLAGLVALRANPASSNTVEKHRKPTWFVARLRINSLSIRSPPGESQSAVVTRFYRTSLEETTAGHKWLVISAQPH